MGMNTSQKPRLAAPEKHFFYLHSSAYYSLKFFAEVVPIPLILHNEINLNS